ncbi:hypothetical protein MTO96_038441 [Rhipicephalus appendiculatus]
MGMMAPMSLTAMLVMFVSLLPAMGQEKGQLPQVMAPKGGCRAAGSIGVPYVAFRITFHFSRWYGLRIEFVVGRPVAPQMAFLAAFVVLYTQMPMGRSVQALRKQYVC